MSNYLGDNYNTSNNATGHAHDYVSVTVLAGYITSMIRAEDMLQSVTVVGEISGIRTTGAHAYFDLKDEGAKIACSSFGYKSRYLPKEGELVIIKGNIDFYAKGGKLSLIAKTIEPCGEGLLAMQLEELKKRLLAQGYFDDSIKKPIPQFCKRVAVLTSRTGAVIRDIISTARKNNSYLDIDVMDCRVQGKGSEETVIKWLKLADTMGYDAIIIARGGGSLEDLMPFNSERLVYEIFKAKTPIISAVGHETDYTLCDLAADKRAATPTAAAELVAFNKDAVVQYYMQTYKRLKDILQNKTQQQYNELKSYTQRLISVAKLIITRDENTVRQYYENIKTLMLSKLQSSEHAIEKTLTKLESNNPIKILRQGYAKLYDSKGNSLDADSATVGQDIIVLGDSAKVMAKVTQVDKIKL